jgi:hypothetical protein
MTAAAWALQEAVYAALIADHTLANLCSGRVFDAVPGGTAFPYVVIGEAEEQDGGRPVIEHTLSLHLWSRGNGTREIKQLASAVRGCLDGARLVLDGHVLVDLAFLSADYARQTDGETYRGSLRFRAVTEPRE